MKLGALSPRVGLALLALLAACATQQASPSVPVPPAPPPQGLSAPSPEVVRRADADRVRALEAEVARLSADLRAAEETLLSVESGMRGAQRRAEAVSALAEARIQLDRAARRAPWRSEVVAEARERLAEADRQLAVGHIGSAIFFASRASRIATTLSNEANRVASEANVHLVAAARVNLRVAPSTAAEVSEVLTSLEPVVVERREGDWALVRTVSGGVGFVRADLLRAR